MRLGKRREVRPQDSFDRGAAANEPVLYGTPNLRGMPKIPLRYVGAGLLAIVAIAVIRGQQKVPLPTSCTKAAFALSTHTVHQHSTVKWSMTGPKDGSYVFGIDAASYVFNGSTQLSVKALPGHVKVQTIPDLHLDSGCVAHGYFPVVVEPGDHTVNLFRVTSAGATLVATQQLAVTSPKG